jgi:hypothetical protein
VLPAQKRDAVKAVMKLDGGGIYSTADEYAMSDADSTMAAEVFRVYCILYAIRATTRGKWAPAAKVNVEYMNELQGALTARKEKEELAKEAKDAERAQNVFEELADAWNRYARPCPTGVPADARHPHMCGCKGKDGKSMWCVVGTSAFYNDYSKKSASSGRMPLMHRLGHDKSIDLAKFADQLDNALKKEAGSTKYSAEQVKRSTGKEAPRSRGCIFGWTLNVQEGDDAESDEADDRPQKRKRIEGDTSA